MATVDAFTGEVTLYVTGRGRAGPPGVAGDLPDSLPSVLRAPRRAARPAALPGGALRRPGDAYERFHNTSTDLFASGADTWARPIALSGPIEVAGDVDFDESDEDDLRLKLPPSLQLRRSPRAAARPRLVLATYYTPARGQNLVGTLNGWIDDGGRPRLAHAACLVIR